ncbi:MAG: redoxin domain-containing protein [Acidimicrobiia bacterium]
MSQLGRRTADIRDLGAQPVAVAVTATFSQQAFARSLGVDFPLLSDWDGGVAAAYGARYDIWKDHKGLAKRSVFVIDREGTVRYRWQTEDASVLPDFTEAVDVLRLLSSS